jgi:hypothetical protein
MRHATSSDQLIFIFILEKPTDICLPPFKNKNNARPHPYFFRTGRVLRPWIDECGVGIDETGRWEKVGVGRKKGGESMDFSKGKG